MMSIFINMIDNNSMIVLLNMEDKKKILETGSPQKPQPTEHSYFISEM